MVFSSTLFLFLFLPIVLTSYFLVRGTRGRNTWLLLASLLFYAWGEVGFVLLLLASTGVNYGLGLWVDREVRPAARKRVVAMAVVFNLGLLGFFKYSNFAAGALNNALGWLGFASLPEVHVALPIGISFFTFHALSYVIDIHRGKWRAARDPRDVALYIFFFPQLVAGPILRWSAIAPQLIHRVASRPQFAEGIRRFAGGLAKKVLVANSVAVPADQIFALGAGQLSMAVAWFGILCYSIQIYFDFSGYSDMAVGLGKMFGFQFPENFNFPYVAQSAREFWRRWHISLSTWFRDYLYIPLGGNRVSEGRNQLNLLVVFFLCGLWHGASWTFVAWGLFHGAFLVLERTRLGAALDSLPRPARHLYAIIMVMIGWVLFRSETFTAAGQYLAAMLGRASGTQMEPLGRFATRQAVSMLLLGIAFSMPLWEWLKTTGAQLSGALSGKSRQVADAVGDFAQIALVVATLLVCSAWLAGGTYNPFIYYRF